MNTFHPFTLNWHLRTLTIIRVVPLSEYKLTPVSPFPGIYDVEKFGVGQESEEFLPRAFKSVALPLQLSPPRLDLGLFRQEPAITRLDWPFTPSLRS